MNKHANVGLRVLIETITKCRHFSRSNQSSSEVIFLQLSLFNGIVINLCEIYYLIQNNFICQWFK